MTDIEQLVRSELQRLYPALDDEPEWERVTARVEGFERRSHWRVKSFGVSKPRLQVALTVVASITVAAAAFSLTALWRGSPSFTARALAAVGSGRYVHAVLEARLPFDRTVDLSTGVSRPVLSKIDYVLDSETSNFSIVTYIDGVPMGRSQGSPDPGLAAFASGYRKALANHAARIVGETMVDGRRAKILRYSVGSLDSEDVAVDSSSYQPRWIRYRSVSRPGHVRVSLTYRVLAIDSAHERPAQGGLRHGPLLSGGYKDIRRVSPAGASAALRHTALWVGRKFGGLALQKTQLQRVSTFLLAGFRPRSSARGLMLRYASRTQWLEIQETPTAQAGYGFYGRTLGSSGPLPHPPKVSLSCDACGSGNHAVQYRPIWQVQLRKEGLYLTIQSWSRHLVVAAARSIRPI